MASLTQVRIKNKDFGSGSQTENQSVALATKSLEDMHLPLTFQPVE